MNVSEPRRFLLILVFRKLPQNVCKLWTGQHLLELPDGGRRWKPLDPLALGETAIGRCYVPPIATDAYALPKRRYTDVVLREKAVECLVFQQAT